MARPRKSSRDEWLDTFADWDLETQEAMVDVIDLIHRQTKRRAARVVDEPQPEAAKAEPQGALKL